MVKQTKETKEYKSMLWRKLWLIARISISVIFIGGLQAVVAQQPQDTIRNMISEVYNNGNVAPVDTVFAPDFVRHPGETDLNAFKISVLALRAAMPDLKATIELLVANSSLIAVRLHLNGTFENEYVVPNSVPIPANNQPIDFAVNIVYRLNDAGLVAEEWDAFDNLNFLAQLGVLPSPSTTSLSTTIQYPDVVDTGMSDQNQQLISQYFDALNQGSFDFIDSHFKDDLQDHNPFGTSDRSGMRVDLENLRGALPDLTTSVQQLVTQGNWTVAVYTLQGTFTGNFVSGTSTTPPTGKALNLTVITFFRFDQQGMVAETFELYDGLSFLTQLGLIGIAVQPSPTP